MENWNKVVRIGTVEIDARPVSVFCKIKMENGTLSITGVEGPKRNGDAVGSCGQIVMSLQAPNVTPAPGWKLDTIARFLDIWREWHLNDIQAGTPAQTAALKDMPAAKHPVSHYSAACAFLKERGLNPDNGYQYGSAWLKVAVPDDVVAWLRALPDTDRKPAWV